MKSLSNDEKKYINDKVEEKVKNLQEKYDKKNLKELVKKDILSNANVKNAIKFLETIVSKDSISERSKFNYYIYNGEFEFGNIDIYIKLNVKLSSTITNKLKKYDRIFKILHNLEYNRNNLSFEKYYILFITWEAPNSERLNKINELIELIYKDITA